MAKEKTALTKAGTPRKNAPGQGRKPSAAKTLRVVAYVSQATYDRIDAVQVEQCCTPGRAIDLLLAPSVDH